MTDFVQSVTNTFKKVFNNGVDNNNNNNFNNFNNIPNNHYNNGQQTQQQAYINDQRTITVQRQTFIDQVDNTYKSITLPAKLSQNPAMDDDAIDSLTDGAILTLDGFIVSVNELKQENDIDTLDLGKKRVYDKWNELQSSNPVTYKLTKPYLDFLLASLNGQNNTRYNMDRIDPLQAKLFQRDIKTINKSYAHLITSSQNFSKKQKMYLKPDINDKLKSNHLAELNEFKKNQFKYNNNNNNNKPYNRPNVASLYFTKSGQNSKFQNLAADDDQKDMMDDIMGIDCPYDAIPGHIEYDNVIANLYKINNGNIPDKISKSIPCQIIYPTNYEKLDKIQIRCAKPYDGAVYNVPINVINFDIDTIKKREKKYINKYGTLGDNYKSLIELEQQMLIDDDDD